MLESLRLRVTESLSSVSAVTLSTSGPGGIQAGFFPCEADNLDLYLLIPASSDVLFNLETNPAVVVTTPRWQLEGRAKAGALSQAPLTLKLAHSPRAAGCVLVNVRCLRIHFRWSEGWGNQETIDCNSSS